MYFKRSLLALAICASVVSVEAVANTRANDMASSATPASVGHRPVVTKDTKNRSVWGTDDRFNLQIADVFIEDEDGDPLSLDKMNNADDIKWYLVDNEAADPSGTRRQPGRLLPFLLMQAVKKLKSFTGLRRQRGRRIVHSCLPLSY